ncbi:hypothetical protein Tco_0482313 [Tanacetum coccineum]
MKRGFRGGYLDIYLPAMLPVVDVDQSGRTSRINSGSTITVDSLETELKQTKLTMGKALMKLVKKVKNMEDVLKRRHVVLPDSEDEDAEISSKQGRNLQEEGLDEMVRNMIKDKSEVFKTPTQGKTLREEVISPYNLLKQLNLWQMLLLRDWQKEEELMRTKEKKASSSIRSSFYTGRRWEAIRASLEANAELTKLCWGKGFLQSHSCKDLWRREELQTEISKKQRIDDKDVSDTKEKVAKVKEEEQRFRDDKEGISRRSYESYSLDTKSHIVANWKDISTKSCLIKTSQERDLIELVQVGYARKYGNQIGIKDAFGQSTMSDFGLFYIVELGGMQYLYVSKIEVILCQKKICPASVLKMKLLDGKMNEVCYKLLKMIEKQAGVKK